MRRWLVLIAAAALLAGGIAEAGRGRFGRGAHGNPDILVPNPDPPPTSFSEILTVQTLATDGWCSSNGTGVNLMPPAVGNNAIYVAYMTDDNGCEVNNTRTFKVMRYGYAEPDGWTTSATLSSGGSSTGQNGHEQPAIFRDPIGGFLWMFHGGIACSRTSGVQQNGPCYYKSTNPDDVSAWGTVQRAPHPGSISEPRGGFIPSTGKLFMAGSQQWAGSGYVGGDLSAILKTSADAWTEGEFVHDDTGSDGTCPPDKGPNLTQGDPTGGSSSMYVHSDDSIHVKVGAHKNTNTGATLGGYYIKSTDGGTTWTSANGSSSFTFAGGNGSGLALTTFTSCSWVWPSANYQVFSTAALHISQIRVLSTGKPIIAHLTASNTIKAYKWNTGTTWDVSTVTTASGNGGIGMEVAANGDVYIYASNNSHIDRFVSTDDGATWSAATRIYTKGSEPGNAKLTTAYSLLLGGKERVILQWGQSTASGATSNIMLLDIPL